MAKGSMQPARSALVLEDIPEINAWVCQMLRETFPDLIIDQAYSLKQAQALVNTRHYDIALIDLSLPDGKGLEMIDWFGRLNARTQCVVMTLFDDDQHLLAAICHGAKGYILKDLEPLVFQYHLRQLLLNLFASAPTLLQKVIQYLQNHKTLFRRNPVRLTPLPLNSREKQVFVYIAKGRQASDIGLQLGLSSHTISEYNKEIYRKLNISSQTEATQLARRYRLMDK